MGAERRFIRHTLDVPLEVQRDGVGPTITQQGVNVSSGGLAFLYDACPVNGDIVRIRIPTVEPPFEARARVVWCRPEDGRFLVGVEFQDSADAFRVRMVEQVCAVEQYREKVLKEEGRRLSSQEAAAEWIGRYAGRFPSGT
ncbi:hypothetical protein BH23GEM10_BH23GEM10_09130 [soil metagenome]